MNGATPGPEASPVAPLFKFLEQMAPHNVLAQLQASLAQKQAPQPAPAAPWVQTTGHQDVNIGLRAQQQYVGKRARAGTLDDKGYMVGIGDVAESQNTAPAASFSSQPNRVPSTVGLGATAATNERGIAVAEKAPVVEPKNRYTLYAPVF